MSKHTRAPRTPRSLVTAAGAAPAHLTSAALGRGPMRTVNLPGDAPLAPATAPAPELAPEAPRRRAPRRSGTGHPEQIPQCACQWGPTTYCLHGEHTRCHQPDSPSAETYLTYADDTLVWAPGLAVHQKAEDQGCVFVWLADRTCRWRCSCPCHTETAQAAPVRQMADGWEQPGLPL